MKLVISDDKGQTKEFRGVTALRMKLAQLLEKESLAGLQETEEFTTFGFLLSKEELAQVHEKGKEFLAAHAAYSANEGEATMASPSKKKKKEKKHKKDKADDRLLVKALFTD